MRRLLLPLLLLSGITMSFAADNQAFLGIFAETKVTKMAGMPAMPAMPQVQLPPGMDMSKIPGLAAMFGGGAERRLEVRLWSPGIAPADASAWIAPPAGLKQGDRLGLGIYRPKPEEGQGGVSGNGAFGPAGGKFTIKIYWGSSPTVRPGQPKIIQWDTLSPEAQRQMREAASKARATGSYFYKPDWTTGYWPAEKQPGVIAKDASLVGEYNLTTNYTGNVSVTAPEDVDFLAPIDITSPDLTKQVPLDAAIHFEWQPIPHALGLHASIFGMEGKDTIIIWYSSEVYQADMMATDWGYMQMADVKRMVDEQIMMKGDRTSMDVPAGIFKDCDMTSMTMVGYGPGAARSGVQPIPRIQTKTSLMLTLGGKMMAGAMHGMGGGMGDQ